MKAKYQIAPSKAVVGDDLPMKALSMHYTKVILEKYCVSSQSCNFVKILELNSFMHMFNVSTLYRQWVFLSL